MPFKIVREDITKIKCDAIVNPTNEDLEPGGGVDAAIHKAAGEELYEMCQSIGGLSVGRAKITPAYNLSCKYIIHTVGPWWNGGNSSEKEYLQSCYKEALKIAKGTKCESVAFPLISSGLYGYPKDQVLKVALEVIKEFLYENDMLIYIAVYDKAEYSLSEKLSLDVAAYIDNHYEEEKMDARFEYNRCFRYRDFEDVVEEPPSYSIEFVEEDYYSEDACEDRALFDEEEGSFPTSHWREQSIPDFGSKGSIFRHMYDGFSLTLMKLIDEKGMDDVECYKKANVSRQTWYKILNDPNYKPNKKTIISFAIALELGIEDTQKLLATAGFILSKSNKFDIIIMYCIVKKIYDVSEIDSILFQYDQETLFSLR